ncbi:uncharacterized protein LOC141660083 [Apium graveolens]|uniref:uncharacterized protein LOC141660083 n=1 Tax=Apium graveolens TaxID=4045 RepID=UPI003D7A5A1D
MDGFRSAIKECGLTELDLVGGEFTWERSKGSPRWVRERLDRAFANGSWWRKFPLYKLTVTHTISSDHDPIILEHVNVNVTYSRKQFRFKFENTWINEPNFKKEVAEYWKSIPPMHMLPKLLSVSSFMEKWGRIFFTSLEIKVDDDGIKQYFAEKSKLDEILYHEELYWRQRAKAFWLTEGDTNSKFFHSAATKRKKLNTINHLVDEEETRVDNQDVMAQMAVDYFQNIFAGDTNVEMHEEEIDGRVISNEQNDRLVS